MEPLHMIAGIFGLVLLAYLFSSSGKGNEENDVGNKIHRSKPSNYINPEFPPWMSPPDWQDLEYDYYRRPRIYSFQSVIGAYFKGAFFMLLALFGLLLLVYFSRDKPVERLKEAPKEEQRKQEDEPRLKPALLAKKPDPIVQQKKLCAKSSRPVDIVTLEKLKQLLPELEYFRTPDKRYYAVCYKDESENKVLNQFVDEWRKKYRDEFNFDFSYYPVNKLCTEDDHESNIVHAQEPSTWICTICGK